MTRPVQNSMGEHNDFIKDDRGSGLMPAGFSAGRLFAPALANRHMPHMCATEQLLRYLPQLVPLAQPAPEAPFRSSRQDGPEHV